ncbi:MAG: crossover junction endodeoxyribonuclease RuvC [Endomicrobium sp.]|jgi:crossover junction endodeoxyribonuclease RuvC|nr:crossover junction endodeoxyribonuclease RuvC [Endomicrobium sp.]
MIVMGIDPGLSLTGWALIEVLSRDKIMPVDYGCIKTTSSATLVQRLQSINLKLQTVLSKYKPGAVVIEELFFLKTSKSIANLLQARGAIILTVSFSKVPLFEYNPRFIKMALTGYGSASKYQIQQMVKIFLRLKEVPKPDDIADALAMAICHVNTRNIKSYNI